MPTLPFTRGPMEPCPKMKNSELSPISGPSDGNICRQLDTASATPESLLRAGTRGTWRRARYLGPYPRVDGPQLQSQTPLGENQLHCSPELGPWASLITLPNF